ncbi:hypothetical protein BDF14DRAFT_1741234 [Spinellus fusiger]|nr:hypothetical protein BDF14DRAFT_1741234 [Spinellus fusiger]
MHSWIEFCQRIVQIEHQISSSLTGIDESNTDEALGELTRNIGQKFFKGGKKNPTTKDDNEKDSHNEDLLNILLSELGERFFANNETQQEETMSSKASTFDNKDDISLSSPENQIKGIPSGYSMKSCNLIDLISPQISLRNKDNTDHSILFVNERIHMKTFSIMDSNNPDTDTSLMKTRRMISIDNAQMFIVHRNETGIDSTPELTLHRN